MDDIRLRMWEMRYLSTGVRARFTSDMRIVLDYLAEGAGYRSDRPVIHKEALIKMLRVLDGDGDVKLSFEETAERVRSGFRLEDAEVQENMRLYW